jgi:hypothetical protein
MSLSKIAIAAGISSLLLLSGCSTVDDSSLTEDPVDTSVAEEGALPEAGAEEITEFNENEITNRATLCEDVLSAPDANKSSAEYKGCLLETEIPNLASFLASEEANVIYHVIVNSDGEPIEIVAFLDNNGNNKYDEEEKIDSYIVPLDIMTIDVLADSNPNIEGTQVSGLGSMTFTPAA